MFFWSLWIYFKTHVNLSVFNLVCFQLCVFHLKDYGNCKDGPETSWEKICRKKNLENQQKYHWKVILPRFASPKNSVGFCPDVPPSTVDADDVDRYAIPCSSAQWRWTDAPRWPTVEAGSLAGTTLLYMLTTWSWGLEFLEHSRVANCDAFFFKLQARFICYSFVKKWCQMFVMPIC